MNAQAKSWIGIVSFVWGLALAGPVSAQTFGSGSTGADGAFTPTCAPTPCTVTVALPPSGAFNYTTVTIPAGTTVTYTKNAANTPVTILATGDVTITGTINLAGENGRNTITGLAPNPPGEGGPGGFRGGFSGGSNNTIPPGNGQGPGGGVYPGQFCTVFGCFNSGKAGTYGPPSSSSFVSLLPLFGGSGGSGTAVVSATQSGYSGAGGGGAILIASSTKITLAAGSLINAEGGNGFVFGQFFCGQDGGPGSGGAARLVAQHITGTGRLRVIGGGGQCAESGAAGRIRVEAFSFEGFAPIVDPTLGGPPPTLSLVTAPGPVAATSNPALINLPTLTITSVGGVAPPAVPAASYATADVSLPQGTPSSVPVVLVATNMPVGTIFRVRAIPKHGPNTTVDSGPSTGNFNNSTATVIVPLPLAQVTILTADASFTLPQLASLVPEIDGEPVDRIMVAANYGEPSSVLLVTKSGKQVPVAQLPLSEQLRLAAALEAAFTGR